MKFCGLTKLTLILLAVQFSMGAKSQSLDEVRSHRIINKHYTPREVSHMFRYLPQKYVYIKQYYMNSFIFESVSCGGCTAVPEYLYDVSEDESLRQLGQRTYIDRSARGYKVTLLSKNELSNLISNDPGTGTGNISDRSFVSLERPLMNDDLLTISGLNQYCDSFHQWKTENVEDYRELCQTNSGIHWIDADEFIAMPANRQQHILQNGSVYIIAKAEDMP
jgi:hypothetical protein